MMQQIEDGYNEAGPDGLTLTEKRDVLNRLTHEFVDDQYDCWNARLRPALSENGIRVLGLHELDSAALRFVDEYCEKELDPLLTPVTVDPAHPFPRVINKALCLGFLLRRRRRSALTYTGVVSVPRALPRWCGCRRKARRISFSWQTSWPTMRYVCITDMTWFRPRPFESLATAIYIWRKKKRAACWSRYVRNYITVARVMRCAWRLKPMRIPKLWTACERCSSSIPGRCFL